MEPSQCSLAEHIKVNELHFELDFPLFASVIVCFALFCFVLFCFSFSPQSILYSHEKFVIFG